MTEQWRLVYVDRTAVEDEQGRFGIVSLHLEDRQLPAFLAGLGVTAPTDIPEDNIRQLCGSINGRMTTSLRSDNQPAATSESVAILRHNDAEATVRSDNLGHEWVDAMSVVSFEELALLCNPSLSRVQFEMHVFTAEEAHRRKDIKDIMEPIGRCVLSVMFLPPRRT
jgi:hypothetical protein